MEVPRAYFPEEYAQGVLPNSERANQEPTVLDRQIYGSPLPTWASAANDLGIRNPRLLPHF